MLARVSIKFITHKSMQRLDVKITRESNEKMNKKYYLYMHAGSGNHGCEAIVRTVSGILGKPVTLFTKNKKEDLQYIDSEDIVFEETGNTPTLFSIDGIVMRVKMKLLKQKYAFVIPAYKNLIKKANADTVAFSIGGDNYCYDGMPEVLKKINAKLNTKGTKMVLYGCSIEPELLQNEELVQDLRKYALIVPRESITYDALVKAGLKDISILASDPAFTLGTKVNADAEALIGNNTVGINLSPLVLEGGNTILYEAYCRLIEWILNSTDMRVALIPHVIWSCNDDRMPLQKLYDQYAESGRIVLIDDHNAMEQKGYISKCRFFVGARTHATIAAYSSKVPTLVAGYSVKSKGIATDIFGTNEKYVVDTKNLVSDQELVENFKWIYHHEYDIRKLLDNLMPEYIDKAYAAVGRIKDL